MTILQSKYNIIADDRGSKNGKRCAWHHRYAIRSLNVYIDGINDSCYLLTIWSIWNQSTHLKQFYSLCDRNGPIRFHSCIPFVYVQNIQGIIYLHVWYQKTQPTAIVIVSIVYYLDQVFLLIADNKLLTWDIAFLVMVTLEIIVTLHASYDIINKLIFAGSCEHFHII